MKSLWRTLWVAVLALQMIAMPLQSFAQKLHHSQTYGTAIHHHVHDHAHDLVQSESSSESLDSHEHGCISHCHVPAALLGRAITIKQTTSANILYYSAIAFTQRFTEPIDRPQWLAARF